MQVTEKTKYEWTFIRKQAAVCLVAFLLLQLFGLGILAGFPMGWVVGLIISPSKGEKHPWQK